MENINEFLEKNQMVWLFWYSTIDKIRSIYDIQNEWAYTNGALYRYEPLLLEMEKHHMIKLKKDNSNRKKTLIYAYFDWIPTYLKINNPNAKIEEKHFKELITLLNKKSSRKIIFSIDKIIALSKFNIQNLEFLYEGFIFIFFFFSQNNDKIKGIFKQASNSTEDFDYYEYFILLEQENNEKDIKKINISLGQLLGNLFKDNQQFFIDKGIEITEKIKNNDFSFMNEIGIKGQ